MICPRCKLDHALWADRKPFDKETAGYVFRYARDTGHPVHPSLKVRVCEALSEEELYAMRP